MTVPATERLDRYLADQLSLSRTQAARLIAGGCVQVNDQPGRLVEHQQRVVLVADGERYAVGGERSWSGLTREGHVDQVAARQGAGSPCRHLIHAHSALGHETSGLRAGQ